MGMCFMKNWLQARSLSKTGMLSSIDKMDENVDISGLVCTFCGGRIPEYQLFPPSWVEREMSTTAKMAEDALFHLYYEQEFMSIADYSTHDVFKQFVSKMRQI